MPDDVRYRWIDGPTATDEEWSKIDEILATRGWTSLNRATSRIRLAEDATGILGFLVLQMYPHVEPLFVRPSARGKGVAERLSDDMIAFLQQVEVRGFELTADSPHAAKLAEAAGLRKVESPVYRTVS